MALITCPECGKEISDKAQACIHCGCPIDREAERKNEISALQISPEEMKSIEQYPEFNCIINGTERNVKWLVDLIRENTNEDLEKLKKFCQYYADFEYDQAREYQYILRKQDKKNPDRIFYLTGHLVSCVWETLDLSREVASQFIVQILDNDILVPKVFNGLSKSEWSAKEIEKTKERLAHSVHCKYCGSKNVKRLGF